MKYFLLISAFFLILLKNPSCLIAQDRPTVQIASFNIKRLGETAHDIHRDWEKLVEVVTRYDIVALVEVMERSSIDSLIHLIETKEQKDWDYVISDSLCKSGYCEHYSVIWRTENAEKVQNGAEGYFPDPGNKLVREPFFTTLRAGNFDFTIACMHVYYGNSVGDRKKEIKLLDEVYKYVQDFNGKEGDVILVGDFNRNEKCNSWKGLKRIHSMTCLIPYSIKTTIAKSYKGANSYDNIWFQLDSTSEFTGTYGIYNYSEEYTSNIYTISDTIKTRISDHRPVWASFYTDIDDD